MRHKAFVFVAGETRTRFSHLRLLMRVFRSLLWRVWPFDACYYGFCPDFGHKGAESSPGVACMNGRRSGSERRKWARLPLPIPVFVRSQDDNSNEILEFATALNVSAGGMLVAVRKIAPVSSEIRLEIPSAPVSALGLLPKASRALRARVLRSTPIAGYNLLGLKFFPPLLRASHRNKPRKRKAVSLA